MKKLLSLLSSACAANCSFTTILTEKPSSDLSLNPVKIICSFLFLFGFQWTSFFIAFPLFLQALLSPFFIGCRHCLLVGSSGLEPPTSCLSGMRSNLLSYEPVDYFRCVLLSFSRATWWRWGDSNPWPPACRAGALPAELHPLGFFTGVLYLFSGPWKLNNSGVWVSIRISVFFSLLRNTV